MYTGEKENGESGDGNKSLETVQENAKNGFPEWVDTQNHPKL